jgi:hypothetical protein
MSRDSCQLCRETRHCRGHCQADHCTCHRSSVLASRHSTPGCTGGEWHRAFGPFRFRPGDEQLTSDGRGCSCPDGRMAQDFEPVRRSRASMTVGQTSIS